MNHIVGLWMQDVDLSRFGDESDWGHLLNLLVTGSCSISCAPKVILEEERNYGLHSIMNAEPEIVHRLLAYEKLFWLLEVIFSSITLPSALQVCLLHFSFLSCFCRMTATKWQSSCLRNSHWMRFKPNPCWWLEITGRAQKFIHNSCGWYHSLMASSAWYRWAVYVWPLDELA